MVVEIASDNSSHRDRVRKRKEYFDVPTLWYYLVVAQDEMYVIFHKKGESGNWETLYFTEPIDTVDLEKFGLKLPLSEIYKRVKITTD
jgi:Uma2 family endonuclease